MFHDFYQPICELISMVSNRSSDDKWLIIQDKIITGTTNRRIYGKKKQESEYTVRCVHS